MTTQSPVVRAARAADLPALAALAGELVRQHHAFDPRRFLLVPRVESGYEHWFRRELQNPNAVLLTLERAGEVLGYAYARLEERDWNALLDPHGALHDLFVAERARGQGLGAALLDAALAALRDRGATLIVLHTASQNQAAQRLFAQRGFRVTMLEMSVN